MEYEIEAANDCVYLYLGGSKMRSKEWIERKRVRVDGRERRYMKDGNNFTLPLLTRHEARPHPCFPSFLHLLAQAPATRRSGVVTHQPNGLGQQPPPIFFSGLKLFNSLPIPKTVSSTSQSRKLGQSITTWAANSNDQIPGEVCFRAGGVSWRRMGFLREIKVRVQKTDLLCIKLKLFRPDMDYFHVHTCYICTYMDDSRSQQSLSTYPK